MIRDPKHNQIDRYIPNKLSLYAGGFLVLYSRTSYWTNKIKTVLILVISYGILGGDLPPIAEWFTIGEWVLIYAGFVFVAGAVEYFVRWPLTIRFKRYHNEDSDRSPIRRDTKAILAELRSTRQPSDDD